MTKRKYDPDDTAALQDVFVDHYEAVKAYGKACKATGISPRQVQKWQEDPEFKARLTDTKTVIQGELEEAGIKRALGQLDADDLPLQTFINAFGEETAEAKRERAIGTISKRLQGSDLLLMFHLKAMDPDRYRENSIVDSDDAKMRRQRLQELATAFADERRERADQASPDAAETAADVDQRG